MILYKHHLFAGWPNCLSAWDTSHHWLKNQPGKTVPVAYSSQDTIKARAKWLGDVDPAIQNSLYAYFQITVGGNIHKSNPVHLIKGSDGSWVVDNQSFMLSQTIAALYGQKARYDPTFTLTWKFYIGVNGNANARDAGVSNSCLYVTYADPAATLYHSVVHTGCKAANGQSTEQDVFDTIWTKFSGNNICLYSVTIENGAITDTKPENKLYYYGIVAKDAQGNDLPKSEPTIYPFDTKQSIADEYNVIATEDLLRYKDGRQDLSNDFLRFGINHQMQFTPGATLAFAMCP